MIVASCIFEKPYVYGYVDISYFPHAGMTIEYSLLFSECLGGEVIEGYNTSQKVW